MDTLVRENALDTLYHCVDPGFRIFERPSKLYLLVTHYNSIQYLQKCLTSIFEQEVSIPLQVSLVDDASSDPYISDFLDEWKKQEPERLIITHNQEKQGKGVNLFKCLDAIHPDSDDILCVVDGDDWLASPSALQTVVDRYQTTNCWVTYGSYSKSSGQPGNCTSPLNATDLRSEESGYGFRKSSWKFSHLFTAKAFLWLKLPRTLNIFDGLQATVTADQIFNLSIAEMASSKRIQHISKILVIYNDQTLISDSKVSEDEQLRIDQLNRIRKPFTPIHSKDPYDISILLPCRGRRELLETTMKVFLHENKYTKLRISINLIEHSETPEYREYAKQNGFGWIYIPLAGGSHSPLGQFNRSLCFDIGVFYGPPSKYYLLHDNDLLVPSNYWSKIQTYLDKKIKVLQPYSDRFVWQTNQAISELIQKDLNWYFISFNEQEFCIKNAPGAKGGSLLIESDLYKSVGGHDPQLIWGYGPEDSIFWLKCRQSTQIEYADNPRIPLTHLWHLPAGSSNPLLNEMDMLYHFLTHQIPSEISKYVDMKSAHFKKCIPIYEVCS